LVTDFADRTWYYSGNVVSTVLAPRAAQVSQQGRRSRVAAPRLVFLGTGGGANAERCHAAIAVQLAPQRVILLDAGGGFEVVRQLRRAGIDLAGVTRIFLSHRHSDHILGLEPLLLHIGLQAMQTGRRAEDVCVYGHPEVLAAARTMIEAMASFAPQFLASSGIRLSWQAMTPDIAVTVWPGVRLTAFDADHLPEDGTSFGCVLSFGGQNDVRRLLDSGDTRPTAVLERHARGADTLIHEAGGLDAQGDLVRRSGHSTAGEAARLAAAAGVRSLFLNHVPRDCLVPALLSEARHYFHGPVAVPADLDTFALE
jgi:ribonuclease Z